MKVIPFFITLFSLAFLQMQAYEKEAVDIDTTTWAKSGFEFKDGKIELLFPTTPTLVRGVDLPSSYLTAIDEDGMSFQVTVLPLTDGDFDIVGGMEFLRSNLQKTPKHTCIYFNEPSKEFGRIAWTDNLKGDYHQLAVLRGKKHVFFLEACSGFPGDFLGHIKDKMTAFVQSAEFK